MADLAELASPELRYALHNGPDVVKSLEDARQLGLNCIALAHLALRNLGIKLPARLRCYELFYDRRFFEPVDSPDQAEAGDLFFFGRTNPKVSVENFQPVFEDGYLANWRDFPITHVGINTGETDGELQILHATHIEGTATIWPLRRFSDYSRYQMLYKITRPKDELPYAA